MNLYDRPYESNNICVSLTIAKDDLFEEIDKLQIGNDFSNFLKRAKTMITDKIPYVPIYDKEGKRKTRLNAGEGIKMLGIVNEKGKSMFAHNSIDLMSIDAYFNKNELISFDMDGVIDCIENMDNGVVKEQLYFIKQAYGIILEHELIE